MPCAYKEQSIMVLHLITCVVQMNKFAGNYKYILAGDFNFTPDSLMYKMITQGGNYTDSVEKSSFLDTSAYVLKFSTPMKSAYQLADKEPLFTNCAHTINNPPFSGCLDYIFISRGWEVNSVKELPSCVPDSCYPSATEPSDHLMLVADLTMKQRVIK